jgi:hypothetical protein
VAPEDRPDVARAVVRSAPFAVQFCPDDFENCLSQAMQTAAQVVGVVRLADVPLSEEQFRATLIDVVRSEAQTFTRLVIGLTAVLRATTGDDPETWQE